MLSNITPLHLQDYEKDVKGSKKQLLFNNYIYLKMC